jgi:hypothetical protein
MNAPIPDRQRKGRLGRSLGYVGVTAIVVLAVMRLGLASRYERVLQLQTGRSWQFQTVRNGKIFILSRDEQNLTLHAFEPHAAGDIVALDPVPPNSQTEDIHQLAFEGADLYYVREPRPVSKLVPAPVDPNNPRRLKRVRRISGGSKAPATMLEVGSEVQLMLLGSDAFLVTPSQKKPQVGASGREIWLRSLARRTQRKIGTLPAGVDCALGPHGISYVVDTKGEKALLHLGRGAERIERMPNPPASARLDTENGTFWVEPAPKRGRQRLAWSPYREAGKELLAEWSARSNAESVHLVEKRGPYVYLLLVGTHSAHVLGSSSATTLARVRTSGGGGLEKVAALPQGALPPGAFDGDYYYFECAERRENWLDWSAAGLRPQLQTAVYRIRLNEKG